MIRSSVLYQHDELDDRRADVENDLTARPVAGRRPHRLHPGSGNRRTVVDHQTSPGTRPRTLRTPRRTSSQTLRRLGR